MHAGTYTYTHTVDPNNALHKQSLSDLCSANVFRHELLEERLALVRGEVGLQTELHQLVT